MSFSDLIKIRVSREALQKGNCEACSLKGGGFVPAELNEGSKVLVIGEAPGEKEVEQRRPFVGKSGQLLRKVVEAAGFGPGDISISNCVKCRPKKNKDPSDKEVAKCTKLFLERELQVDESPLVILAGSIPKSYFLSNIKSHLSRGNFIARRRRVFLHTWHPAHCLYDEKSLPEFERDIRKAKQYLDGTLFADRKYVSVETPKLVEEFVSECLKADVVSVDIEYYNGVLYCVGISPAKNVAYCLPMEHSGFSDVQFRQLLMEALHEVLVRNSLKIYQNAKYDIPILEGRGFELGGKFSDTMFQSFLEDETKRSNSLKAQVVEKLDGYSNIVTDFNNPPWKSLMWYNCEDVDYTRQLYFIYEKELSEGQKWVLNNSMLPALSCLMRMEKNGCKIDVAHAKELGRQFDLDKVRIRREIDELHDEFKGVNIGSNPQLVEVLIDKLRYKSVASTKLGAVQLDEIALKTMEKEQGCEVAGKILEYRGLGKKKGTYIDGMLKRLGPDGRIHSTYSQIVAVTGRLSSSNPNLQNIDTDERIRDMFVAEDGCDFVETDFAQQELRIAASLANETTMIEIFNRGGDIHSETASIIVGKRVEEVTKKERYNGKPANFGLIFGQGVESYQQYAKFKFGVDMTMAEAAVQRAAYFRKYNRFPIWHQMVQNEVVRTGQSISPFGRVRHLPDALSSDPVKQSRAVRQAINFPVQSAGSEVALIAMARSERMLMKLKIPYKIVLQVHDSFMSEVPKEYVEDYLAVVRDVAKDLQFDWLRVPLLTDFKVGKRWGSLVELDEAA